MLGVDAPSSPDIIIHDHVDGGLSANQEYETPESVVQRVKSDKIASSMVKSSSRVRQHMDEMTNAGGSVDDNDPRGTLYKSAKLNPTFS
jgi:hypothetical protein